MMREKDGERECVIQLECDIIFKTYKSIIMHIHIFDYLSFHVHSYNSNCQFFMHFEVSVVRVILIIIFVFFFIYTSIIFIIIILNEKTECEEKRRKEKMITEENGIVFSCIFQSFILLFL